MFVALILYTVCIVLNSIAAVLNFRNNNNISGTFLTIAAVCFLICFVILLYGIANGER